MKKFLSLAIASSLAMFVNAWVFAQAATQGDGLVRLGGVVIDSACGLEVATSDQTIEMASEPIARILRDGAGQRHPFQLRLVNCSLSRQDPLRPGVDLPDWDHLRVTFEGPTDRDGRSFFAFGGSQGVAFHIQSAAGEESIPGMPMALHSLLDGDMTLNYTIHLIGNGVPLLAGNHTAVVRFKLEYF